jgi:hypothetical protein
MIQTNNLSHAEAWKMIEVDAGSWRSGGVAVSLVNLLRK